MTCEFKLLATHTLPLQNQLMWLWFAEKASEFVVGDEKSAFTLSVENSRGPKLVDAPPGDHFAGRPHPWNLPMSGALYEQFIAAPCHGFRFLDRNANENAVNARGEPVGDLLRTLVFGPDYGQYVQHPASGLILSLRARSMELLQQEGGKIKSIDKTKTRGSAVLAYAAHPSESMIAYGDNGGTFHAHRFDASGFGKASKIAAKERKASRLEFINDGKTLVIGGMGYLSSYNYADGKFAAAHEVSTSVRDFVCAKEGQLILVNQGMHGVTAYRPDDKGLTKVGELKPGGSVQQIAVSACGKYLAATAQDSPQVGVFEMTA